MERMWRKVNQGLTGRSSKSVIQSDTASSAGFGGEHQVQVVAVSGNSNNNNNSSGTCSGGVAGGGGGGGGSVGGGTSGNNHLAVTGRRLASSGEQTGGMSGAGGISSSFSQHVLHQSTASSERRRRRRRKSRPRTTNKNGERTLRNDSSSQPPIRQSSSGDGHPDISLRQRAVAKLRMFNFHLNWDLHMNQCKPCGPRSSGNIITRRLCRNRRREDNELYRSNSFKFERFERKEVNEIGSQTLQRKISVCDDYSLPIDFVKKRPSSFDPCLAETLPDNWAIVVAPSPLSEHVSFLDPPTLLKPNYPQPPPLPTQQNHHNHFHHNFIQQQNQLQQENRVKLVEGYSDPKDSKKHTRIHYRKTRKDKRSSNYSSDSSAPKSSADEYDNHPINKVPDLNSPDSISEDLVRPLHPHKSPKKLYGLNEINKRNPSPYYYSDLLKEKAAAAGNKDIKNKYRQSTASEPPQFTTTIGNEIFTSTTPYRKSTSLDVPEIEREDSAQSVIDAVKNQKRYSITEEGVRIIRCQSPSTTTSDDSDCSECQQRREWHAKALALVRKTCNITAIQPLHLDIKSSDCGGSEQPPLPEFNNINNTLLTSMPPHRLFGPSSATVCACTGGPTTTLGDDIDEYFRPRSIFYVHPQGVHECADCSISKISDNNKTTILPTAAATTTTNQISNNLNKTTVIVATTNKTATTSSDKSNNSSGGGGNKQNKKDDDMSSGGGTGAYRVRQIYETAFDCKISRSDDDLDDVDRLTNHSILLEIENGNNIKSKPPIERNKLNKSNKSSRLDGKRLKNSKNHAIQQDNNGSISTLSNDLENIVHIDNNVDQLLNNTNTISTSQLPIRGYTPSPPSTAPLPIKFPGKHDHQRFYMNSIKSAPNLPSSNPSHPRLKDLRLPIQSLRHQLNSTDIQTGSNTSSILLDSGTVQPTVSIASSSRTRDRPRSVVLESGRVLELRKSSNHQHNHHHNHHHHHHHNHNHNHGAGGNHHTQNRNGHNNYSSTESMATSSSGGSMESIRSSTSEGNRSTTSSESRHSTSLSSHSSESGSSVAFPLRQPQLLLHSKLHILSPISDKSSLEPASDASEINKKLSPAGTGVISVIGNCNTTTGNTTTTASTTTIIDDGLKNCNNGIFITTKATIEGQQHQIQQQNDTGSVPKQLKQKRIPQNKTLLMLTDEILGSDSGISLHSREDGKIHQSAFHRFGLPKLNFPNDKQPSQELLNSGSLCLPQDLHDLPFDMPKLRRRKIILQQDGCTSGSATSVDLGDLPFDMPKLRRRLRLNQPQTNNNNNNNNLMIHSTESSGISQASSSHSVRDEQKNIESGIFRQNLTLNLNETKPQQITNNKFGSLDLRFGSSSTTTTSTTVIKGLNLNLSSTGIGFASAVDLIDVTVPLERQGWYHGAITRIEAETTLRPLSEGSFLVRNCESTKQDYSLSLKGAKGFMHMRIQRNDTNQYILGQFSRPFDSIPEMIRHFCINRLPVRGAEHMCLLDPVIVQLL